MPRGNENWWIDDCYEDTKRIDKPICFVASYFGDDLLQMGSIRWILWLNHLFGDRFREFNCFINQHDGLSIILTLNCSSKHMYFFLKKFKLYAIKLKCLQRYFVWINIKSWLETWFNVIKTKYIYIYISLFTLNYK